MKKLLLGLFVLFMSVAARAADYRAALVADMDTGRVLISENANMPNYPASLTKIMTLYLTFDALEQNFPYSEWAERAQIMMAYTQYLENKYAEALLTLERFIQLHPGNKNTPYALYLKGLCYFEQMSDITREQDMSAQAGQAFQELIARYPDSKYRADAEAKLVSIKNHLAGKEVDVGRYYQKHEDYVAAMNRFQQVLRNYPETNQAPEAYYRLVACYWALGMKKQAVKVAKTLSQKYEQSDWTKKALKLVKD